MRKEIFGKEERDKILQQISSQIKKNKTFFLSGHQKPDGDTVASELALASLLSRMHKSVEIYNAEPVPESLMFLPGTKKIRTAKKVENFYDAAFIFECCDSNRMGNIIDLKKQAKIVINIDHHLKNSFFGQINFVNSKASSNAEQLYYLFEKMNFTLTKNEANCLYVGMMTDTGRFQYSNTNAETLRIASKLLERGVKTNFLCEKIYGTRTLSALKLLGLALSKLQLTSEGKIATVKISQNDFQKTNSTEEETEEIVNYGLEVPGVLISILFREGKEEESVKVSLRSRKNVNVHKIAESFGGGGHRVASGCKISGELKEVERKVLAAAKELIGH